MKSVYNNSLGTELQSISLVFPKIAKTPTASQHTGNSNSQLFYFQDGDNHFDLEDDKMVIELIAS